jgi:outer membrane protein W
MYKAKLTFIDINFIFNPVTQNSIKRKVRLDPAIASQGLSMRDVLKVIR